MDFAGDLQPASSVQRVFFKTIFRGFNGYACLGILSRSAAGNIMQHRFFHVPDELDKMVQDVATLSKTSADIYFCPQLFDTPKIHHSNIRICPSVWADLDECSPDHLEETPTAVTETSPGRYQAL
jgi:hypothetical protein